MHVVSHTIELQMSSQRRREGRDVTLLSGNRNSECKSLAKFHEMDVL
jgi:hypothetical protein